MMKIGFTLFLVLLFLCGILTGCAEGEASQPEPSGGTEISSPEREYRVILPANHSKAGWNSPTGSIPDTTEELYHYYEEHPELADYYYDCLVPLNFMLGDTWGNGQKAPTESVELWAYFELNAEEKEASIRRVDLNQNGNQYLILDREILEQKALETFGFSAEALRDSECYYEEHRGYLHMGPCLGQQPVYVIDSAEESGKTITIVYRRAESLSVPEGVEAPAFRLVIERHEDGSLRYTSSEKLT